MAGGGGCRKREAFRRMFSSFLDEEYDNFTSCRRAENIRCVLMSETWRVSGRVEAVMLLKSILMTGWFAPPISLSPTTWSFLGSSVLHLCAPQVNSLSSSGILFVHLSAFKICDRICQGFFLSLFHLQMALRSRGHKVVCQGSFTHYSVHSLSASYGPGRADARMGMYEQLCPQELRIT